MLDYFYPGTEYTSSCIQVYTIVYSTCIQVYASLLLSIYTHMSSNKYVVLIFED